MISTPTGTGILWKAWVFLPVCKSFFGPHNRSYIYCIRPHARLHAPGTPELITAHMTRAHADAHWQQICREQDARADAELHANRLRAADEERAVRAHERTEQLKLANEELARDLRAIDEEAERRREYHAAADANFDHLQVRFHFLILCTKLTHAIYRMSCGILARALHPITLLHVENATVPNLDAARPLRGRLFPLLRRRLFPLLRRKL